jgi:nitrite reductase/ring-hydroxylating ferredoxin subunit
MADMGKTMDEDAGFLIRDAFRLPVLGSRAFTLPDGTAAFVVRTSSGFVAYRNTCPHWGVDLDLGLGDFVDPRTSTITCRNHGAEFEVETGLCTDGPCEGDRLEPIRLAVEGELLRVGIR